MLELLSFGDFVETCSNSEKYVGYLRDGNTNFLLSIIKPGDNYCVLIGPEGDFDPEEIKHALTFGFQCISLGENRLRIETAGLVACHILNIMNKK